MNRTPAEPSAAPSKRTAARGMPSERTLLFLIGAIQFVNILDFMMVMPLGPDFARALDIPTSRLGYIGGSYTAAAAVSGMVGSLFLDRYDRRKALAVAVAGLVLGTAAGGFATGLSTLMAARVVAGAFGGPATSLALSIVADVIPPERRGKAMGAVGGAFSVASVLGVPMGLELAELGGWRLPFFTVAGMGIAITAGALSLMPPMRAHLEGPAAAREHPPLVDIVRRPAAIFSLLATATIMLASFAVIPNLSAYLQDNLGYPRDRLGLLYLVGGVVSFVGMRAIGALVDRLGSPLVSGIGTLLYSAVLAGLFLAPELGVPVMLLFVGLMGSNSFRSVSMSALTSRVPRPLERARFMSVQSATQHVASAAGAFLSASLLTVLPDGRIDGMAAVSLLSIGLAMMLPLLLAVVAAEVRKSETREPSAAPALAEAPRADSA